MSVISSRLSSVSSILKSPGARSKVIHQTNRVRFKLPKNLRDILTNFENGTDHKQYENLICTIRDSDIKDNELMELMTETSGCISLLGRIHRLFVESLLSINWTKRSAQVTAAYKSFLVDLISAHNYHTKLILDRLVEQFQPDENGTEWAAGEPRETDLHKLGHIHDVLRLLLRIVPMATDLLLQSLVAKYPYMKRNTHSHEIYVHALLQILEYAPYLRSDILSLIINRLIDLDVNTPRSEIEKYDDDEDELDDDAMIGVFPMDDTQRHSTNATNKSKKLSHPLAHTLDVCMEQVLSYMYNTCHVRGTLELELLKSLYHEMLKIFEQIILPTHASHHVQFIMFYLCSFKTGLSEVFVNYLWRKVSNPNVAPVIRQASVCYIASLLARAMYIPIGLVKAMLLEMSKWMHSYISSQDSLECANSDVRVHAVFYSVCQAMFYVIAFRHKHLVETKKNLLFLQSLNLTKIVTCRLNPLKVCQSAVVQNFAAITRTYQLAYCYTIIEHNSRGNLPVLHNSNRVSSGLDTFFPFDPYVLRRSGARIIPIYMLYQGTMDEEIPVAHCKDDDDEDDFMDESISSLSSSQSHMDMFSYGTSPGFIHP